MRDSVSHLSDRSHQHEPVTPAVDGRPPRWIVRCSCGFAHDAHGETAAMAIVAIRQHHPEDPGHVLTADRVDYLSGWAERPGGDGPKTYPHPLYRS